MAAVVQVKVQVFWRGCGCSGVDAGVLDKVLVFLSVKGCSWCSGVGAGVLDKMRIFRSVWGCSF